MFSGGNPFETDTTVIIATVPQVRVASITGTHVGLIVECIRADGHPALVLERADLRVGDILTLNNLTISLSINHKGDQP